MEVAVRVPELLAEVDWIGRTDADEAHVLDALRAGASGYLVKGETRTPARLCEATRLAAGCVQPGRGGGVGAHGAALVVAEPAGG